MTRRTCSLVSLAATFVLIAAPVALAQFSSDPAVNFDIADRASEQVQPKIRLAPDGSFFVSWFDNAAGGYDVYLQHLSASGNELWPHNGILVADRSFSSTVDYDLRVDAGGNALVAFNDDRSGMSQITVAKVAPDGSMQWTAAGVTVSSGTVFKANPRLAVLSDADIMVGWSESPGFKLQKLDPAGVPVGATQTISESGRTISLCDLQPSDNGSFIALWVRPFNTSGQSNKYLYTQKYDAGYAPLWPVTAGAAAVVVYGPTGAPYGAQGGSVQNGYFPPFFPDGAGGAIYGWYENAGPRTSYVQHVLADGSQAFQLNGLPVTGATPNLIKVSAGLSYDASTGDILLGWSQTDSATQSQYALLAQKITSAGVLAWGAGGTQVLAPSFNQNSFCRTIEYGGGCYIVSFDARSATTGVVVAARIASAGTLAWPGGTLLASSRNTGKARLDVARSATGQAVLAWTDGPGGLGDVLVQDVNPDGTLGNPACTPDINHDGLLNSQDFFDFLTAFFAGCP
jgi:hypothetical protein